MNFATLFVCKWSALEDNPRLKGGIDDVAFNETSVAVHCSDPGRFV